MATVTNTSNRRTLRQIPSNHRLSLPLLFNLRNLPLFSTNRRAPHTVIAIQWAVPSLVHRGYLAKAESQLKEADKTSSNKGKELLVIDKILADFRQRIWPYWDWNNTDGRGGGGGGYNFISQTRKPIQRQLRQYNQCWNDPDLNDADPDPLTSGWCGFPSWFFVHIILF